MDRKAVTDEMELEIRRMVAELERRLLKGNPNWDFVKPRLEAMIEGREYAPGEWQIKPKKHDLAEQRRLVMEQFFRTRGFPALNVPKPNVSNREFARREKFGNQLFYMPFKMQIADYDCFITSVGQANHWTVIDQAKRAKIGWQISGPGYWFWVEVSPACPRLKTSWNDFNASIRLLSLEEYAVVWHFLKANGTVLDHNTLSWLRTRYDDSGALYADGYDGEVFISRSSVVNLSVAYDDSGGRASEVV